MTRPPDVDQLVESWLAEGPSQLPDRVVQSIVNQLDLTPQRRLAWLPGREQMNRMIFAIGGAAAILIVVAAGAFYLGGKAPGIGASPSPSPSAAATQGVPTPVTNLPSWYTTSERPTGPGILPAGSHTTQRFSPGFTFSVPEGWVNPDDSDNYFALFPDTPANQAGFARSESLAQVLFMGVHPTPYFTCESLENNRGGTAAEMVAAASANEALAVSEPVDVSIGDLTGKQFDVRRNPDWTGACPGDADLLQGVDPEDERTRGIFLDVPGRGVLVIGLYSMSSAEHDAFLAEAMPILESFQFSQ